jgi:hypothetical protein
MNILCNLKEKPRRVHSSVGRARALHARGLGSAGQWEELVLQATIDTYLFIFQD